MKECDWSERVAMYAGGDLNGGESKLVLDHLARCSPCSVLLAELADDQVLLRQSPEVSDEAVNTLRSAVLAGTHRPRPLKWLPFAAALLLASSGLTLWFSPRPDPVLVAPVAQTPPPRPTQRASAPALALVSRRAPRKHKAPRVLSADELAAAIQSLTRPKEASAASSDAQVVITAMTSDPDVVIVLVGDSAGGAL